MGLDAVVFCDCHEKGRLRRPPPHPKALCMRPNGSLDCRSEDPAVLDAFDEWRQHACQHEDGMIAGACLGNMVGIEEMKAALKPLSRLLPVLLRKVIYSGTHTGDHLTIKTVEKLKIELDRLRGFKTGDRNVDNGIKELRVDLSKLVRVALRIRKPIAF